MAESQAVNFGVPSQEPHTQAADGLSNGFSFGTSAHSMPAVPAALAVLSNGSSKLAANGMMSSSMGGSASVGSGSGAVHLRVSTGRQQQPLQPSMAEPSTYASSTTSVTSTDDVAELQSRRLSGDGASTSGQRTVAGWHPHDPEHLIVNGLGGAFLHPTHVFSPSRFVSGED